MGNECNAHLVGSTPSSRGDYRPVNDERMTTVAMLLSDTNLLKEFIMSIVDEAIERHMQQKPKKEKMLKIKETAALLETDPSTLWHWDKEGYLKKIYIGGKPRYKESEVLEILEGRNLLKRKQQHT